MRSTVAHVARSVHMVRLRSTSQRPKETADMTTPQTNAVNHRRNAERVLGRIMVAKWSTHDDKVQAAKNMKKQGIPLSVAMAVLFNK